MIFQMEYKDMNLPEKLKKKYVMQLKILNRKLIFMLEKINKKNIEHINYQMVNLYNYMIKDIEHQNYYSILKNMDIQIYKVLF